MLNDEAFKENRGLIANTFSSHYSPATQEIYIFKGS